MKTLLPITFSTLLLIIFSCNASGQPNEKPVQSVVNDIVIIKNENAGNKIEYNKTEVFKSVYVIDRKEPEIKQQADENAETLGAYEYGEKLTIIEETEKWFGIQYRLAREFLMNGNKIQSTRWERVYILKGQTGSIDEITLIPADLYVIYSLSIDQKKESFEPAQQIKEYIEIELIDKHFFDSKKSSSVNFLLADTTKVKKKNGVITLKCQTKVKKYIDKPDDEENLEVFNYVGQVDFLNTYLINGIYYEGSDYTFVDKSSGAETQVFGAYPNISADKKHIICMYANPYETTADLELYSINDAQIEHVLNASFKNWMPAIEPGDMFWSPDSYLYLAVKHVKSFWKSDGNFNGQCQYIRIKAL